MEVKWVIVFSCAIIIAFILGLFIGKKSKKIKYDGQLFIGSEEERDQFRFIFETELEDLKKQKQLIMEIVHSQN